MRIIILSDRIPPESVGGAGRVAWSLARGLRDLGHEVHVIAATNKTAFNETREDIATYHIHSHYPPRLQNYWSVYNPQTIGPLRLLFEAIRPDVLNAHNVHSDLSYYSLSVAHHMKIPVVFNSHDVMPFTTSKLTHFIDPRRCGVTSPHEYRLPAFYNLRRQRLRYNPLRNIVIRHILTADIQARIAVSQAHREALEANQLPPFRVIHNGIDPRGLDVSAQLVRELRRRYGLENRRIVLCAGRLTGAKGLWCILEALQTVVQTVPRAMLVLLSHKDISRGLAGSGFEHLILDHIRPLGWLIGDELAAIYQIADVVVVPSIYLDPFPTVNLEAMAAGKPVIATCYGGSSEVVVDGNTGFVINPFNTPCFASRIEALLTDPDLRARMGQAGQEHVTTAFSLERQTNLMLEVYQGAIASYRRSQTDQEIL